MVEIFPFMALLTETKAGQTALHKAVAFGHMRIASMLREKGINVEITDKVITLASSNQIHRYLLITNNHRTILRTGVWHQLCALKKSSKTQVDKEAVDR
jgi:hypothetical protein